VWWLNRDDAFAQRLAYVDNNGRAVIKVDNTTNVPWNEKRNSVRAGTSQMVVLVRYLCNDRSELPLKTHMVSEAFGSLTLITSHSAVL